MEDSKKTSTKKIADYWNMRGETYSRSWQSLAKKRLSLMETDLVTNVIKNLSAGKKRPIRVLDIGIAIGRISEQILKCNVELYGTDISETMIKICQEKFRGNKEVKKFALHDVHNPIPSGWGTFDVVTAFRVIAYSPQWKKELRNIFDAMRPNGTFIFTFPNRYSSHWLSTHIIRRKLDGVTASLNELKKALYEAGFSHIQITGYSRLLDSFYDWADTKISSDMLFSFERLLEKLLGPTLFVRLFYIICQK